MENSKEKKTLVNLLEALVEENIIKKGEGIVIDSGDSYIEIPIMIFHGKIIPIVADKLNEAIKHPLKIVASNTGIVIHKILVTGKQSLTITP